MPSISFHPFSVVWLNSGANHHTGWNNAPYDRVYAFSASPVAHQSGAIAKLEVTRVWQEHNYDTKETEVHVNVKNIGSFGCYCFIFMSQVHP